MPDIREVYEMITKHKPPEPGALERQQTKQVRVARNRKIGGYAVGVVFVVAVAIAAILATREGEDQTTPAERPPAPGTTSGPFLLDLSRGPFDPAILSESGPSDLIKAGEKTPLPKSLHGGFSYVPSPDGTRLLYGTGNGGCEGNDVTKVANLDGTDVQTLPAAPEGLNICGARWSPDGTKLVFQVRDGANPYDVGDLFVQDVSTGRWTQVTDLELTRAWWWFLSPSFSDDGRNVIFHLPRSSSETTTWDVWSVRATGGEYARRPYTLVLRNASLPVPGLDQPNDVSIAYVSPLSDSFAGQRIMKARPRVGDLRSTVVEANDSIWWPRISPDESMIAYQDGGSIYVADLGLLEGEYSKVADGGTAEWLDNDTLIVTP